MGGSEGYCFLCSPKPWLSESQMENADSNVPLTNEHNYQVDQSLWRQNNKESNDNNNNGNNSKYNKLMLIKIL